MKRCCMATEIDHLCAMLRTELWGFRLAILRDGSGYLSRLQEVARHGGYITEQTSEAMQLENEALELRRMADELMKTRAALLANQPQPFRQAAE